MQINCSVPNHSSDLAMFFAVFWEINAKRVGNVNGITEQFRK